MTLTPIAVRRFAQLTLAGAIVSLVLAAPALAQSQPPPAGRPLPPGRQGGQGGRALQPEGPPPNVADLQDLFDSYFILQAQRQLQLSQEQAPQFIARLTEYQGARRRANMRRQRVIMELRRASQGGQNGTPVMTDDAQGARIKELIKSLDDIDTGAAVEIKQALTNIDQVLDPRQQARFRILEEQLERSKLDILMQARGGRGGRGPVQQ